MTPVTRSFIAHALTSLNSAAPTPDEWMCLMMSSRRRKPNTLRPLCPGPRTRSVVMFSETNRSIISSLGSLSLAMVLLKSMQPAGSGPKDSPASTYLRWAAMSTCITAILASDSLYWTCTSFGKLCGSSLTTLASKNLARIGTATKRSGTPCPTRQSAAGNPCCTR